MSLWGAFLFKLPHIPKNKDYQWDWTHRVSRLSEHQDSGSRWIHRSWLHKVQKSDSNVSRGCCRTQEAPELEALKGERVELGTENRSAESLPTPTSDASWLRVSPFSSLYFLVNVFRASFPIPHRAVPLCSIESSWGTLGFWNYFPRVNTWLSLLLSPYKETKPTFFFSFSELLISPAIESPANLNMAKCV